MAAFLSALYRNWQLLRPPVVDKKEDALKIGILGAAQIAPSALILPARSHPEVIVYAVAARDKTRATAFAQKHDIPVVKNSYQDLIDDPEIDAVYNPLPNSLHLEWTLKALEKGKHVLLEKPSTSNATEAELLFRSPLLSKPGAPVLLEAFHSRFTPAWRLFTSFIDPPTVSHATAHASLPSYFMGDDDIRFVYDLAGGAVLDIGTYPLAAVRSAFGGGATEPVECLTASLEAMPAPLNRCDANFDAKLRFPGGGIAEIRGGLRGSNVFVSLPRVTVTHRPVAVTDGKVKVEAGQELYRTRRVTFVNFLLSPHYHRVDVEDEFVVKKKGMDDVVRRFTRTETKKAYTFKEMGVDHPGETYWSTYRHMLEQFVNQVKGREGTGMLISHEDSIAQAKALDLIYEKSGLGLRPTSEYCRSTAA